ncbi:MULTISPECIES: folate-binding protein YgfZ [Gammaproteobacteria]|uniref:CAF17-like 4Fe-4S cluster assembly/insertion protein YgfZ n=1 Tax=Gammaproteobacteria TaxID=1236 RepID=UPI000DCFAC67|nr:MULTISPECIES: folate-binding protein YgfZ [Gammaproteobacteria]RTE87099.1 folate-binding protein [Aliidiomarina sp. B3213]TCZ93112.1 folate-binding protein [Lysobacter sp. N42]
MDLSPHLPQETIKFPVSSLNLLKVSGADAVTYLQGQLTCNVKTLENGHWIPGGYCTVQGKLLSAFRVGKFNDEFLIILPADNAELVLTNLKKFGVFSKVEITDETHRFIFSAAWSSNSSNNSGTLEYSEESLIWNIAPSITLTVEESDKAQSEDSDNVWQQAMFATNWIDVPSTMLGEQLPQAFNLDVNDGINFKKGCYLGQEAVARMHYRGQTKRRASRFLGNADVLPRPGETLQTKVGENWRRAGAILSAVRYHDGVVALVALVSVDLEASAQCRVEGQDDSQFTRCP